MKWRDICELLRAYSANEEPRLPADDGVMCISDDAIERLDSLGEAIRQCSDIAEKAVTADGRLLITVEDVDKAWDQMLAEWTKRVEVSE